MAARPWKRGTEAARVANATVPAANELGVADGNVYVSDGVSSWAALKRHVRLDEVTTAVQTYVSGLVVTGSTLASLAAESGYVWALVDGNGKLALGVTPAGNVIGKISLLSGSLNVAAFDAATLTQVTGAGAGPQMQPLTAEQSNQWVYAIAGANGRTAFGIGSDGTVTIPKLTINPNAVDLPQLTAAIQQAIPVSFPVEGGYAFAITGANGKVALGITADGTTVVSKASIPVYSLRPTDSSTYFVTAEVDAAGRYQVRANRKSDQKVTISTTSTTVDTVEPVCAADGTSLLYRDNSTGAMRTYWRPLDGTGTPYFALPSLAKQGFAMFGDSLTAGNGSNDGGVVAHLASLLSCTGYNLGISGQFCASVAARQGGVPALITVTSNQIPASGAVTVTAHTASPYASLGVLGGHGTLAGIPGTLTNDGTDAYTFLRDTAGSIVSCPAATPWIDDQSINNWDKVQIFWEGAHDIGNASVIQTSLTAQAAFIKNYSKRFLMLEFPTDSVLDAIGQSRRASWVSSNAAVQAAAPNNYVPVSTWLQTNGLAAVGITPTSQDTTDIANGVTPISLRAAGDTLHLNNFGYTAVAIRVQQEITTKGWL